MPAQQGAGAVTGPSGDNGTADDASQPRATGPSGSQAGRLEAAQVRAMFDRIAGVYDLLNTAMTAGLHHRWRARAADLARVGPGSRVLDVATGTGDLAIELAARVAPGGEVVAATSPRGCSRARARRPSVCPTAACARASSGATRWRCPTPTIRSTPRRSASARATSPISDAGSPRWRAWCARAGAWSCWRSRRRSRPPLSVFYAVWFDRVVPVLGRAAQLLARALRRCGARGASGRGGRRATIADAYTYLPNSVKRFPAPAQLAAELRRVGLEQIAYVLTAGGIVAIHSGTVAGGPDAGDDA